MGSKGYTKAVDWWSLGILIYKMLTGKTPFFDKNIDVIYKNIKSKDIKIPEQLSEDAKDLISKLLEYEPNLRLGSGPLGVQEIKDHFFFENVDWESVYNKQVEPNFRPVVTDEDDISQFDNIFTSEPARDTIVNSKLEEMDKVKNYFSGFTYEATSILGKSSVTQNEE